MKFSEYLETARLSEFGYLRELHRLVNLGIDFGYPRVSDDLGTQALYVACRLDGEGHELAEMLALQSPPTVRSDATFLRGHCNGSQFSDAPWIGDEYAKQAKQAGVDVKGKVYLSGLARYPGDPEAWVCDRADVRRVIESRGWSCEGAVTVKNELREPPKEIPIAEDLVDSYTEARWSQLSEEEKRYTVREEVREQVKDNITPYWAKG